MTLNDHQRDNISDIRIQVHVLCISQSFLKFGEDMFHPLLEEMPSKEVSDFKNLEVRCIKVIASR
jgi:hypothetical protein